MVARGDWIEHGVEEKFLFGTISFLDKDEVKTFLTKVFSEANWQLGNERRPIILVGQGVYQDYKMVKSNFGIDLMPWMSSMSSSQRTSPRTLVLFLKAAVSHSRIC
jgi:hypothetical protein